MANIFFFAVSLSKLLRKQASCWWYELPCPRDHCNTIWLSIRENGFIFIIYARICLIYLHRRFHSSGLIILSTLWNELKREIHSFHNEYISSTSFQCFGQKRKRHPGISCIRAHPLGMYDDILILQVSVWYDIFTHIFSHKYRTIFSPRVGISLRYLHPATIQKSKYYKHLTCNAWTVVSVADICEWYFVSILLILGNKWNASLLHFQMKNTDKRLGILKFGYPHSSSLGVNT